MPINLALGRLKQEDQKFKVLCDWLHDELEANLSYMRPYLKKKKGKKKKGKRGERNMRKRDSFFLRILSYQLPSDGRCWTVPKGACWICGRPQLPAWWWSVTTFFQEVSGNRLYIQHLGGPCCLMFCFFLKFYLFMFTIFCLQARSWHQIFYRWLWATMLGVELRMSGRTVNSLNRWAISQVPVLCFWEAVALGHLLRRLH